MTEKGALSPNDPEFKALTNEWVLGALNRRYAYNFTWLGRPVIQTPPDIYVIQELLWRVQPDLVIETGIAHGGSLVLSASMLALIDYCDAAVRGQSLDPTRPGRKVVGVDIEIRPHNRDAIAAHPLHRMIHTIEGSSTAPEVVAQVKKLAAGHQKIVVLLDSNHTHEHVLAELEAYAPLTSRGSYCVVWDTGIEDLPEGTVTDRPWGKGNSPKTAVWAYMKGLERSPGRGADGAELKFEIDREIENRLFFTAAPDGYLRRL